VTQHAILSPSASKRWLACPASVRLSADAQQLPTGPAAEHGTAMHDLAAAILNGSHVNVTDDIQLYVDAVRAVMQRRGAVSFIEQKVYLSDQIFGTADALVFVKDELHVFDLKTGHHPVDAVGNSQLLIYAAAALRTFPLNAKRVKRVHMTIVQPHAAGITTATLSSKHLQSQIAGIMIAAQRIADPSAPAHAGAHCIFCPAGPTCPERKNDALQVARMAFVDNTRDNIPDSIKVFAHEYGPRIIEWLDSVKAASLVVPPAGYGVVEGRGRRVWRDDVVIPTMQKPMTLSEATAAGIDVDALTNYKPASPKLVRLDKQTELAAFQVLLDANDER
jgi:hypothetical protein